MFTSVFGVQSYMVQGVRKSGKSRAGAFQPGSLLEMVVYHHSQKNLQRINQYQAAYIYTDLQEDVVKNSIVLFSVEVMLRLLPEQAPMPDLFDFALNYFIQLDKLPSRDVANFPLYFIVHCSKDLGFELKGSYSKETPYLDLEEGEFSEKPPASAGMISETDAMALNLILAACNYDQLREIRLNADTRLTLIDWYIAFLQLHTEHMGNIRSLSILRAILH
jgi:DNA repair protein RecO (recombination protein O)